MGRDEAMELVRRALGGIAPEVDLDDADPGADLSEELDLDSMDLLELHTALEDLGGVRITEADRAGLTTLDRLLDHLTGAAGAG